MLRSYLIALTFALSAVTTQAKAGNTIIPPSGSATAPAIQDTTHIVYTATIDFPLSQKTVSNWIYGGFKILAARGQTEHFETPIDVVGVSGTWAQVDSVRRIEYADGHYSLEKALLARPYYFKSLNWAMTKPERQGVDYTIMEYSLEPVSDNASRFSWSIHIMPNENYATSGSRRAVEEGLQQWMDDTLYQLYSMASSEFGYGPNSS